MLPRKQQMKHHLLSLIHKIQHKVGVSGEIWLLTNTHATVHTNLINYLYMISYIIQVSHVLNDSQAIRILMLVLYCEQDLGMDYYVIGESFETSVPWDR